MDDLLPNVHDLYHIGTLVVAVVVLWSRLDFLKETLGKHIDEDIKRFDETAKAHHDMRGELGTVSNRVGYLEGRAGVDR